MENNENRVIVSNPTMHFFPYTIEADIAAGGSAVINYRSPDYDVFVYGLRASVRVDGGDFIYETSANRDKVSLQIQHEASGWLMMGGAALDILTLNSIGEDQKFKGFPLLAGTTLRMDFSHIASNITTGTLKVSITLITQKYGAK